MFVKQITEQELVEYERALQGLINSVKLLEGNDEHTRNLVHSVIDACEELQRALQHQITRGRAELTVPEHQPGGTED